MDAVQTASTRPSPAKHVARAKKEDESNHGSPEALDLKLAHTLSACTRCRKVSALASSRWPRRLVNCS